MQVAKTKGSCVSSRVSQFLPLLAQPSIFSLGETVGTGRWRQHNPATLSSLRDADSSRGQRGMGALMPHPTFYTRDAQELNMLTKSSDLA